MCKYACVGERVIKVGVRGFPLRPSNPSLPPSLAEWFECHQKLGKGFQYFCSPYAHPALPFLPPSLPISQSSPHATKNYASTASPRSCTPQKLIDIYTLRIINALIRSPPPPSLPPSLTLWQLRYAFAGVVFWGVVLTCILPFSSFPSLSLSLHINTQRRREVRMGGREGGRAVLWCLSP